MKTPHRPASAGYVMVVVLMLSSLMVAGIAAYARHVTASYRESRDSLWVSNTRESAQSSMAFARQVMASGKSSYSSAITAGDQTVSLSIADLGSDKRSIRADATKSGLGSTVVATAKVYGLSEGTLPTLAKTAGATALADPKMTKVSGTTTLSDVVIDGTLVLARASTITLDNVLVKGSIVSEPAIVGPPYKSIEATRLNLRNGVRVTSGSILPGCGIVMPDGVLVAEAGSRIEIQGVIVGASVTLQGTGAVHGHVLGSSAVTFPAGLDRPGWGRTPLPWPAALELSAWGVGQLAFPPASASATEISVISKFAFPKQP